MNVNNCQSEVICHEANSPLALLSAQDTRESSNSNFHDIDSSLVFGNDNNDETLMDETQPGTSVELFNVLASDTTQVKDMDIDREGISKLASNQMISSNEVSNGNHLRPKVDYISYTTKAKRTTQDEAIRTIEDINSTIQDDTQRIVQNDTQRMELDDTQRIVQHDTQRMELDDTQRIVQHDTQRMELDDTQRMKLDDTQRIVQDDTQRIGLDDTQRIVQDHTQRIVHDDTQRIGLNDTQRIVQDDTQRTAQDDTQRITEDNSQHTTRSDPQRIIQDYTQSNVNGQDDTQNINTDKVSLLPTKECTVSMDIDTQKLEDSQINGDYQFKGKQGLEDTQIIKNTHILGDTQILAEIQLTGATEYKPSTNSESQIIDSNFSEETQENRQSSDETTEDNVDATQILNDASPNVQIPDTAKHLRSHTQVVNTQESPIKYGNQLSTHYSSCSVPNGEIEEVKTEDEDDGIISQTPEDSLITTKLKRKFEEESNDTPRKLLKTPMIIHNNKTQLIHASPVEIEDSSPVVKKSDILNPPSESSPLKLSNTKNLQKDDLRPPSSPELVSIIDSDHEEHESSELNCRKNIKQSPHIAARRRKKYVIESQDDSLTPADCKFKPKVFRSEVSEILTESDICCNESVWVSYNLKMYTGCLIEYGLEYSKIEFDEGLYTIKNSDIYLLDIRIGDSVSIKNSTSKYRVTGLSFAESQNQIKCIRGYNVVYLQRYNKSKEFSEFSIQLCECFMDISDWVKHQQNFKLIYGEKDLLHDNIDTPLRSGTQLSAISERTTRSVPYTSPTKSITFKRLPIDNSGKVFSRKIFFITSIEGERKEEIIHLIKENGGLVINEDIYSMFNIQDRESSKLKLNIDMEGIKFCAMISNNYCRSAKYLQALALGWPILSDTFIVNCCQDTSIFNNWPVYLLPAGKSKYLQSIKSLEIYNYRKNFEQDFSLEYQLQNNHHLLEGYYIIIFNNRKNSDTLETCKFIFYSFGVRTIKFQSKVDQLIKEVKKLIRQDNHNILIYDDSNTLHTKLQDQIKTYRKTRSSNNNNNKIRQKLLLEQTQPVGLINWEWVVQCVISSYIWPPQKISFEED